MSKRKGLYATLSRLGKKEVRYLQPYYYQGGKWYKLGGQTNGSRGILSKLWESIRRALGQGN